MDKGRALGSTGFCFPEFLPVRAENFLTRLSHGAVNHGGGGRSDLLLGNGFRKPPLPLAMKEIDLLEENETLCFVLFINS